MMTVKGFDFGIDNMERDVMFTYFFLQAWQRYGPRPLVIYDIYFGGVQFTEAGAHTATIDRAEAGALMYTVRWCAEQAEARAEVGLNYVEFILAD